MKSGFHTHHIQNSHDICTKIPNEVTLISFKFRLFWLSPGWAYSGSENHSRRSKAVLSSHSQIKVRIRVYIRIKYKTQTKLIISGTKLLQTAWLCRRLSLESVEPRHLSYFQHHTNSIKNLFKKSRRQKPPHDLPSRETKWEVKHEESSYKN